MKSEAKSFDTIDSLPKPKSRGGVSLRLVALTVLVLGTVGGAALWLTRDEPTREEVKEKVVSTIDKATEGTPLATLGTALMGKPPPPPPAPSSSSSSPTNPAAKRPSSPGIFSDNKVQGPVEPPIDSLVQPNSAQAPRPGGPSPDGVFQTQQQPAKVASDSTVRPDFIEDLAAYLVSHYKPSPSGGTLNVSVQGINQRYGTKLTGLTGPSAKDRASVLRYVFHPAMIQGLYAIYVTPFLNAVDREVEAKKLPPTQAIQVRKALAGRCVTLAAGLESIAKTPDLDALIKDMDRAAQNAVEANSKLTVAMFNLDQLREAGTVKANLDALQKEVDTYGVQYRNALEQREASHRSLVAALRKNNPSALDDDTLLFLALWVDRRNKGQSPSEATAAVQAAAGVLRDLSVRCTQPTVPNAQ
ncbi:MAG: hypothetical protein LBR22_00925 [Desulfovibrio sp.]|jgi:hypothetical protein|nr:hypothetical protein [Desulfovibrio sp.]